MPDKISAAAEKLAAFELQLPVKKAGGGDDQIIIRQVIIDPLPRIIGRQIIGCFEIGEYLHGSIYDKIARSVVNVLQEASVEELLVLRNTAKEAQ
jgi:hypothetical protein